MANEDHSVSIQMEDLALEDAEEPSKDSEQVS